MDAAGAERLRWRIEQQEHWRQADAVLDGRQPSVDPDLYELESLEDGLRLYTPRMTRAGIMRLCKRLVDGVWEHGMLDEQHDAGARSMAHVA
ncbi:MAG TPA: hypothetical protein VLV28_05470 [Gaiellaceae bacterium]|nr:hypothetical protein [Gaiellaceae bacterium]